MPLQNAIVTVRSSSSSIVAVSKTVACTSDMPGVGWTICGAFGEGVGPMPGADVMGISGDGVVADAIEATTSAPSATVIAIAARRDVRMAAVLPSGPEGGASVTY
jgi:hypothetical protein